MIYAGVDIAKMDHVIGAVDERGAEACRPLPFKNTEAGLERAVAWLEGLAGSPSDVVVGMEATGHYRMACYSFWIGYIFLDDFGRTKPAFLNSTGVMYPSVECILKLLYQCT